ncbi:MAG: GDP-L-fucose synthase [Bacteroidota bacterium]|nr:GDP-L-fucose synthase [Bacteroidota bacterium]
MEKISKILIAGHTGLVGSAIVRKLQSAGFTNLIFADVNAIDFRRQQAVEDFFAVNKPEYVFLAAAKVGGIHANNTYRAEFIYDNLMIEANIINSSYINRVKKLLFLGSSCIYPKLAPQPLKEEYLLTSALEYTNEPYAVAKIAGIKICESYNIQYGTNYISAMPTNLYGINDNFHPENSHVLPALIRRFHEAKINNSSEVTIWGSGSPLREFLYVEDLADALLFLINNYDGNEIVNIGTGEDVTIKELAELIKEITGFGGELKFDASKPDGTPRKLLDVSKINNLGWKAQTTLKEGIEKTYQWYRDFVGKSK